MGWNTIIGGLSNMTQLNTLIMLLDELKNLYNVSVIHGEKGLHTYLNPENGMVDEISNIVSDSLFSKKGRLNFELKADLQRAGYMVSQLQGSKEGWLIAGITIPRKGILVVHNHVLLDQIEGEEN
jgi:hypothetical protein